MGTRSYAMNRLNTIQYMTLLALIVGATGCTSMNRLGVRMDQAVTRVTEPGPLVYEGRLEEIQVYGAMTSMYLSGGKLYDVAVAPLGLKLGDVVRIYKTEKGLEARLWKVADPLVRS